MKHEENLDLTLKLIICMYSEYVNLDFFLKHTHKSINEYPFYKNSAIIISDHLFCQLFFFKNPNAYIELYVDGITFNYKFIVRDRNKCILH